MGRGKPCCDGCGARQNAIGGGELVTPTQAGNMDSHGRFLVATPPDPPPGLGPTPEWGRRFVRNWAPIPGSFLPGSTVAGGRWSRGRLERGAMPAMKLTSPGPMYDPTDPATWAH